MDFLINSYASSSVFYLIGVPKIYIVCILNIVIISNSNNQKIVLECHNEQYLKKMKSKRISILE